MVNERVGGLRYKRALILPAFVLSLTTLLTIINLSSFLPPAIMNFETFQEIQTLLDTTMQTPLSPPDEPVPEPEPEPRQPQAEQSRSRLGRIVWTAYNIFKLVYLVACLPNTISEQDWHKVASHFPSASWNSVR